MKPWLVLSLLSSLMLVGCIEDPKTTASSGSQSYGVSYSGQTNWALLETMDEVQAFVDAFELHHRNQALMESWPTQLIELTPDSDVTEFDISSCGDSNTIGFDLQTLGVAEEETVEVDTEEEQAETATTEESGFDNQVLLNQYCSPVEGWNKHTEENGLVRVVGSADQFTSYYNQYRIEFPGLFEVQLGGSVLNKPSATLPTQTYNLVIYQNQQPSLKVKFEDLKVTESTDGTFYGGYIYHPDYGKVFVSTDDQNENLLVTEDGDNLVNRPIGGTLRFTSNGNTALIRFNADASFDLELDLGADGTSDASATNQAWPSIP